MPHRLAEWWEWQILTYECPGCGAAVARTAAMKHADLHILNNDVPRDIE